MPNSIYAQESLRPNTSKDLKHTYSGRIDKIIDGQTILLTNDKIVRLSSIDCPASKQNPDFDFCLKSRMLLTETLPEGTEVMIYQTRMAKKGRINRMGHDLGHILTKEATDKPSVWVQELLLLKGLSRVYISPDNPELSNELLHIEDKAHQEKAGLWAEDSPFISLSPETVINGMGEFSIVEGTVAKASSVRNTLYLNFGENWKTDFTIMISSALRKKLAQRGINLMGLTGQKVRVRGWIRDYNGPLIELDTPEHIEIIASNSPLPATPNNATVPINH
ncbi:MAG: thermonuclease family protein [Alphaproteobacteria bacterium]|nr:thermonuclease family protein [Alphaproteobacteria bacterium]